MKRLGWLLLGIGAVAIPIGLSQLALYWVQH